MKAVLSGCAILVASGTLFARTAFAEVDESTAHSVLQETVLWDGLISIPAAVREDVNLSMSAARRAKSPARVAGVIRGSEVAFTTERAQTSALQVMRKGLDAATVSEISRWTATPLARRLLAQERAFVPSHAWQFPMAVGQFAAPPVEGTRRKLLTDIIDGRMILDGMSEIGIGRDTAMEIAYRAAEGGKIPPEDMVRIAPERLVASSRQRLSSTVPLFVFSRMYSDFSIEELRQYAAYLDSPAAKRLNELIVSSLREILRDADIEFVRGLSVRE